MRRFLGFVFVVVLAAAVAAVVVKLMGEGKRYAGMTEEEIRADLERKLSGRLSDEALQKIQETVVEAIEKARPLVQAATDGTTSPTGEPTPADADDESAASDPEQTPTAS
ncbi:MAG TPA: hypothetical protein ENK55_03355 [Actinobacteria bacterium]|nr:hypothetical protein [Actinomycetota bacterium]